MAAAVINPAPTRAVVSTYVFCTPVCSQTGNVALYFCNTIVQILRCLRKFQEQETADLTDDADQSMPVLSVKIRVSSVAAPAAFS